MNKKDIEKIKEYVDAMCWFYKNKDMDFKSANESCAVLTEAEKALDARAKEEKINILPYSTMPCGCLNCNYQCDYWTTDKDLGDSPKEEDKEEMIGCGKCMVCKNLGECPFAEPKYPPTTREISLGYDPSPEEIEEAKKITKDMIKEYSKTFKDLGDSPKKELKQTL